jgi:2-polyprenyl-3-methyl-5-hydroxy-6-metoxy-1,4-benzoquinol methylase
MELSRYLEYFNGTTDLCYLEVHYPRYQVTQELAYQSWKWDRANVLDIGAHWLHQSVFYALDGHHVTAADLAITFDDPAVRKIASTHDIRLLTCEDLSAEAAFDELEDDSMDVVLFCEILEHLTFNPSAMWKAIYRVLRPGGRIILTTPNHYALSAVSRQIPRFLSGWGSGISVTDILHVPTHSPHWKEFSRKELRRYFDLLSPDFSVRKLHYCSFHTDTRHLNWKGKLVHDWRNLIPVLRNGLYAEVDLPSKMAGISIQPDWTRGPVRD